MPKGPLTDEHKAAMAEGRRKAKEYREQAKAAIKAQAQSDSGQANIEKSSQRQASTVNVTYLPLEGDPHTTIWNGVEFKANIPVALKVYTATELRKISDAINNIISSDQSDTGWKQGIRRHIVTYPRSRRVMAADGMVRSYEYQEVVSMVELAKNNPSFQVDGYPRAQRLIPNKKVPPAGADWVGTNRDDLIDKVNWPTDYDPHADAVFME